MRRNMAWTLRGLVLAAVGLGLTCALRASAPSTLAEVYREALAVTFPDNEHLRLHATVQTLSERPEAAAEMAELQRALEGGAFAGAQALAAEAMLVLDAAASGDLERYKARFIALKAHAGKSALLKTADVSDLLVPCPACGGEPGCRSCRGALKCPACKGRGYTLSRSSAKGASLGSSLSLSGTSAERVRCKPCRGTGKCPDCDGAPSVCTTCRNSGKMPEGARVRERLAQLAVTLREALATQFQSDFAAREQTALLAADLKRAQALPDAQEALDFLASLPPERVAAAQWSHVGALRALLGEALAARAANAAQQKNERAALRAEVARAQRLGDPIKGMAELVPLFERYAACDALPEVQTAFDGLFEAARSQRRLRSEALDERVRALERLQRQPALLLEQAQALRAEWPEAPEVPKALNAYAAHAGREALAKFLKERPFEAARERLEGLSAKASALQAEAEAGPAWWVWGAIGLGALVAGYLLYAAVMNALARKTERERAARQRATLEEIRKTMAHRHR